MSSKNYTDKPSESEIRVRHPKAPTEKDLEMLAFMNGGGILNNDNGDKLFHCRGMRDAIYRLRKAGHEIKFKDTTRTYADGTTAQFRNWFTKEQEILSAGFKTDAAEKAMKGENVADISREIQKVSQNVPVQVALFP